MGACFCGEWEVFGFFKSGCLSKCGYLNCHLDFRIFENDLKIPKRDFFLSCSLSPPSSPILGEKKKSVYFVRVFLFFQKRSKLWPHLCPVLAAECTVLFANASLNCFVLTFYLHTKPCHLPKTLCLFFISFKITFNNLDNMRKSLLSKNNMVLESTNTSFFNKGLENSL